MTRSCICDKHVIKYSSLKCQNKQKYITENFVDKKTGALGIFFYNLSQD